MSRPGRSAASQGLYSCQICSLVSSPEPAEHPPRCPRCNARLHFRRPDSIAYCWALVITGYILIIPANTMIMMETGTLISYRKDTILSGVIHLWHTGFKGIAAIVFIASIMVPLFKLVALTLLLISVRKKSLWRPMERIRIYRIVELVGRWSMLDIFVLALLSGLVQLQSLAIVKAGPASIAFGAVVVITMFAAMIFDPRLMWDPLRNENIHE